MWPGWLKKPLARRILWGICVAGGLPGCRSAGLDDTYQTDYPYLPTAKPIKSPTQPFVSASASSVTQASALLPAETQPASTPQRDNEPARPIEVPPGLPGANTPQPNVPADKPETHAERLKIIDSLFPEMPPLAPDPVVDGYPGAHAITLDELLQFATKNSPEILQAMADVEDARGKWVQVGLYPNPTMGFQGDQILDGGPFGQYGGFVNQSIVTAGKLKIARSVVFFDFLNAQARLRKAEVELTRRVRTDYYSVLVAAESVRVSRLLVAFTDTIYRRQVGMLKGGGSTVPFETSAILALTGQSELSLIQARNRYASAWKQLAAVINNPSLPSAPLAGKIDEILPRYRYEALRDRLLTQHTDLIAARNSTVQAERSLVQERRRPIPDIQNQFYFEDDTLLKSFQFGAQVGVQVPLFNRNQGGIMSAKAQLTRANAEVPRVQNQLLLLLADAFERYENARQQIAIYRDQILPNLVIAFRGVYQRYQTEPDKVNYNDIVTAQQNLSVQLAGYLAALRQQWQAEADLAGVVQVINPKDLVEELGDKPAEDSWPLSMPRRVIPPKK